MKKSYLSIALVAIFSFISLQAFAGGAFAEVHAVVRPGSSRIIVNKDGNTDEIKLDGIDLDNAKDMGVLFNALNKEFSKLADAGYVLITGTNSAYLTSGFGTNKAYFTYTFQKESK